MFTAVVVKFKKCEECDGYDAGFHNRLDCGCYAEVIVGDYESRTKARLVAMGKASRKGTTLDGRMTGDWSVESDEGIIEAGCIHRKSAKTN